MAQIAIVVGSVFGAAQSLAERIKQVLEQKEHQCLLNPSATINDINQAASILVITSTTGQGDLPNNLLPFYQEALASLPLITDKPFGVIALGDSSYQYFCGAGEKMRELFIELQGREVHEMIKIDACETLEPETLALPWLNTWLEKLD